MSIALCCALLGAMALAWGLSPLARASGMSSQVASASAAMTGASGSGQDVVATCPAGTVLVGGGIRVARADGSLPGNGLKVNGTIPADSNGVTATDGATDPSSWIGDGGFGGQTDTGDEDTAFAICTTGGPTHTTVKVTSVPGPLTSGNGASATATATCPAGTRLVGGGAQTILDTSPSLKPVGSYPSDASGTPAANGSVNPDSWTAIGGAGGQANSTNQTIAYAVCSTDATLQTTVTRADVIDHPAGPGNSNPGSDPYATATASCPGGQTLLDGGALASGDAPGLDGGPVQQGVHLRGSYPSDASGGALANGTQSPGSWSSIVQSGGQNTPGTDTSAWALCGAAPAPPASADVSITKSASPSPATVGSPLTYTLTAANAGPDPASGVGVTDTLPSGVSFSSADSTAGTCTQASGTVRCAVGSLASGGSATVTIVVTPTAAGSITNSATIGANEADPDTANNTASVTTQVNGVTSTAADVSVVKTGSATNLWVVQILRYTLTVHNAGPSAATSVTVVDHLPSGVTLLHMSSSQGKCADSGGEVTCKLGSLASGATGHVGISAYTRASGAISNTATVSASQPDPNLANNTSTVTTKPAALFRLLGWYL